MIIEKDGQIIVTELRPMSELKEENDDVLIFIQEDEEISCLGLLRLEEDGYLTDDQDFNFTPEHLNCVGWLPKPICQPQQKLEPVYLECGE